MPAAAGLPRRSAVRAYAPALACRAAPNAASTRSRAQAWSTMGAG